DLDVAGSDRRIADLERRRAEILSSDDQLQAPQDQIEEVGSRPEETRKRRYDLDRLQRDPGNAHGELVDSEDLVKDRLEVMERSGRVTLDEAQDAALTLEFAEAAAPADPEDLDRFAENSQRLSERLRTAVADAEVEGQRAEEEL